MIPPALLSLLLNASLLEPPVVLPTLKLETGLLIGVHMGYSFSCMFSDFLSVITPTDELLPEAKDLRSCLPPDAIIRNPLI